MTTNPKPTAVPTWDSNLTNTVPIVSGHKTDGYATNEVPISAEINSQLNLFGQWDTWLSTLATNGANAQAQLDVTNLSGNLPVMVFRDANGNIRSRVDHLGYFAGNFNTLEEHWLNTTTAAPAGWTFSGSGTVTQSAPTSAFPERFIKLAGTADQTAAATLTNPIGYLSNASAIVCEFNAAPETATSGMGFTLGVQISANAAYGVFFIQSGGHYYWGWENVSTSNIGNTGVAYTAGVVHRFRVEVLGSSQTGISAGHYTLNYFIDGVLVGTDTTNTFSGTTFLPLLSAGSSVFDSIDIGRVRLVHNPSAGGDNC